MYAPIHATDPVVCLYHGDCLDGFTAAWVVHQHFPDALFIPVVYNDPPPALPEGALVYIVDFSYPAEVLNTLAATAQRVVVLDHHETAIRRLQEGVDCLLGNIDLHLDTRYSGAHLTWRYFHPNCTPPALVRHVEDRDLWQFKYAETKRYCRYLQASEMSFTAWDNVHYRAMDEILSLGAVLLADDALKIDWHLNNCLRFILLKGQRYPLVNTPRYLMSETMDRFLTLSMANDDKPYEVVLGYYDMPLHRVFRLNSRHGSAINVSRLAEQYGGGGHFHSAGFRVCRDHPLAQL